jgi:excinuclease ABC subunit C
MREAISRRLSHLEDEKGTFSELPDLILLDGGRGHVSVIRELLRERGLSIPVFGMVKDEFHKTRALTDDNGEISISKETALFNFIYKIQEEVHRYTFGAMEKAKRKSVKRSSLTEINGIGPSKAKALMTHFKSISAIKTASRNEIATVKGMNARDVDTIYMHFHKDEIGEQ